MFEKIKAWIKRKRETAREQQAADRLIKHIEQALGFELYEWQRLYIITGIWQPPEGRLHGRTTAYILRLLLDQSKPLLLYEFSQVAAYADNPFMGRQYQPVPMQYAGWFRHEIRSIYEQLRAAGVPVREMITEQPPEGRLHGRTTAYILRLLLDQSKPLLLYEFSQVAAYADNPFMGRQYQPVPMQYAGWFRHEIRSIYEQLRAAGVPVREMITEQQRVISW